MRRVGAKFAGFANIAPRRLSTMKLQNFRLYFEKTPKPGVYYIDGPKRVGMYIAYHFMNTLCEGKVEYPEKRPDEHFGFGGDYVTTYSMPWQLWFEVTLEQRCPDGVLPFFEEKTGELAGRVKVESKQYLI